MSTCCGSAGAFGLHLSAHPEVADVLADLEKTFGQMCDAVEDDWVDGDDDDDDDDDDDTVRYEHRSDAAEGKEIAAFVPLFVAAFAKAGIVVPDGVSLVWTGSSDDRPARCDTPAEEWVLGFGLFTYPWEYPVMDESFRMKAQFHTWVWMG